VTGARSKGQSSLSRGRVTAAWQALSKGEPATEVMETSLAPLALA